MISWFKTNKALRLKVTQLEQELRGTKMIVGDLERHLVRAQAQASSWRGIAETAQKKLNPPKVDHLQRQLQVERTARQAVQTNKKIIKQMSPAPRPKPVEEDSGRRAGRDPDPIFSDDKPSQSCEAPASSPSVESGGGGDFGGGGASGSWD
jgi:uncharacterized membrane protein YgcG